MKEKISKKRIRKKIKVIVSIIASITVIVGAFNIYTRVNSFKYISEKNITYVPTSIAKMHHRDIIGIDEFEYWVFKLNKTEQKEMQKYLKTDDWSLINSNHPEFVLERAEDETNLTFNSGNCYICVYDNSENKIITNAADDLHMSQNTIYFIYDTSSHYYVVMHMTM